MDEKDRQNIINYLRGMLENLESGAAVLIHFEQERDYIKDVDNNGYVVNYPTGGRIETIHWRPKDNNA